MLKAKRITALLTAFMSAVSFTAVSAAVDSAAESEQPNWVEVIGDDGEVTYYEEGYLAVASRFGDVNADKVIGIADAVQLQRFLLGEVENLGNWKNADLNENGEIDVVDLTMLKQQLTGKVKAKGGTLAVGVVDMLTGESIPGVHVHLFAGCDKYAYDLGEWDTEENAVMYFTGLPTEDDYTYYMDCDNLPSDYGNGYGHWAAQPAVQFGGKKDIALNARLVKQSDAGQIKINMYDWAMGVETANPNILPYANLKITDKDGNWIYGLTPCNELALPDGEYHVDAVMLNYPVQLMDPESDFAKRMKELYPDAVFTDKRNGIDFTVKDGKADKDLTFDLAPLDGKSNYIKVTCKDGTTGEPVEGVKIALIEEPGSYAKKIAEWTSDSTGTHTFDGLIRSGYQWDPPYKVIVEEVPEGYEGGYDAIACAGYIYGYTTEVNYLFARTEQPKQVSANVISFDDKSVCNDAATFEVWRVDPNDPEKADIVYKDAKPGDAFYLPDGKYFAALDGKTLMDNGYQGVSLVTRKGQKLAKFFKGENFIANSAFIDFTVENNKADRALNFYVKAYDPMDDEEELSPEELAKYEAFWGDTILG